MADAADYANDRAEMELQGRLSKRHRFEGVSLAQCIECDIDIPERRREALPGVTLCVDCQQLEEDRRP